MAARLADTAPIGISPIARRRNYGDYEHGAFWFGLEPALDFASKADVLFLGNSRMQKAFSTTASADWFSAASAKYYLMGFSYGEHVSFAEMLLDKMHPQASPDGLTIALQSTCAGDNAARSIWTVPARGTTNYSCSDGRRLSEHGTDATHASWGPSNMIVWGSVAGGTNSSSPVPTSLVTWQDGTLGTLTDGSADDRNPSWSPTGTVIGIW